MVAGCQGSQPQARLRPRPPPPARSAGAGCRASMWPVTSTCRAAPPGPDGLDPHTCACGQGQAPFEGAAPVDRLRLRRSLPARSTMNSLPTLVSSPLARLPLWEGASGLEASSGSPPSAPGRVFEPSGAPPRGARGLFTTVSCTIRWLRLEVAFMAVLATTLPQPQLAEAGNLFGSCNVATLKVRHQESLANWVAVCEQLHAACREVNS